MKDYSGPWDKPVNQKADLHDWHMDLRSLQLDVLQPGLLSDQMPVDPASRDL